MTRSESSLYPQVKRFLEGRGWKVDIEVPPRPGSPRRYDVVGVKPRKAEAAIVEVKLRDFKRTMEQAMGRLFVGDYVYVAFPFTYAETVITQHSSELVALGIGLLALDGKVHEFIVPKPSSHVNSDRRESLLRMVLSKGQP